MKTKKLFLTCLCVILLIGSVQVHGTQNRILDQTDRLAALGKVWGLLKYYHPEVAAGTIDWDAVLVNAIPAVKAAADFDSFNQEINNLIDTAGDITNKDYNPQTPAHPNEDLFKWIKDHSVFSAEISGKLKIVQKKHAPTTNYYVLYAGPLSFVNENPLSSPSYPDENHRLLSLFRYWNIINYFFPYKDLMDQPWEDALEEFIPRFIDAGDALAYHLTVMELFAHTNDSHSVVLGSSVLSDYFGRFHAPIEVRYIENKTIVTRVLTNLASPWDAIRVGDIIVKCNNTDIDTFREDIKKFIPGSNEPVIQRNINAYVRRGATPQLTFTILRDGVLRDVTVKGYDLTTIRNETKFQDNLLPKWKILPGNIGYVHMGILQIPDVSAAMADLMNTEAIIFDLRNYPRSTWYYITPYLLPQPVHFARFTLPDLKFPGSFYYSIFIHASMVENPDYYKGKVVILCNEVTQSQAEYTCMALQTAPGATIIGSQTAGADGDVRYIYLPGGIVTYMTGYGVFYPDGTPTQRVGIVPDIEIRSTIKGIKEGRDEVLERAVQFIESN